MNISVRCLKVFSGFIIMGIRFLFYLAGEETNALSSSL